MNQAAGPLEDQGDMRGTRVVAGQRATGRRSRPGRLRSTASVFVLLLVLAGCSGDGDPAPMGEPTTPVPTATATKETPTEETPTTAPKGTPLPEPDRPAAMDRDDIEGAKAAAEYFLALYPYVYATGDLEAWSAMSHPECEFCVGTSEDVAEIFEQGGIATVGRFSVDEIAANPPDEDFEHFRVTLYGTEDPSTLYSADGELDVSSPGGIGYYAFAVLRQDGEWLIRGALSESDTR